MKTKKFTFLIFILVALLSITACNTNKPGINNRDRNLSTQTRPNDMWNQDTNNRRNIDNLEEDTNDLNPNNMRDDLDPFDDDSFDNEIDNGNLNNGMTRPNNNSGDLRSKSEDIAKKIADLPEIDKTRVILTNDTALVGCRLRGNTQGTITTSLKEKIEKIVKENSKVNNISVTTEPKLYTRIENMFNDINDENPVENFADDIRDLINKITPNMNTNSTPR